MDYRFGVTASGGDFIVLDVLNENGSRRATIKVDVAIIEYVTRLAEEHKSRRAQYHGIYADARSPQTTDELTPEQLAVVLAHTPPSFGGTSGDRWNEPPTTDELAVLAVAGQLDKPSDDAGLIWCNGHWSVRHWGYCYSYGHWTHDDSYSPGVADLR